MLEITFLQAVIAITVLWILLRIIFNVKKEKADWQYEAKLLLVYVCIVVITRLVYFPLHLVDGHVGHLYFDADRILPFRLSFRPFSFRDYPYRGWLGNLIGNVLMFIPVGIVWPFCFKRLDRFWKVLLAGIGFSLFIELSQLLFYNRTTDIDDLITNSIGVLIGAVIYFAAVYITGRHKRQNP